MCAWRHFELLQESVNKMTAPASQPPLNIPRWVWNAKLAMLHMIMGVATIGFTGLVFVQVVVRYFFNAPLFGVEEVATYLAVWLYFAGSAYGVYRHNHISASIMDVLVRDERGRDLIALFVALISIAVTAFMFWICSKYIIWSVERVPRSPELKMPLGFVHVSMVFGLALMLFYYTLEIILRIAALLGGTQYEPMAEKEAIEAIEEGYGPE